MKQACILIVVSFLSATSARAAISTTYSYASWTSATTGSPGSATGHITTQVGTVGVSYSGELSGFQINNTGNYFWSPSSSFTGAGVSNAPPNKDVLQLGDNTQTGYTGTNSILFSAPVTNPVLSIFSLGGNTDTVTWTFSAPFVIVGQGNVTENYQGYTPFAQPQPNVLSGHESDGVIQFVGTFSALGFTQTFNPVNEQWHGFTVGIPSNVPEPASLAATAFLASALLVRRSKRSLC